MAATPHAMEETRLQPQVQNKLSPHLQPQRPPLQHWRPVGKQLRRPEPGPIVRFIVWYVKWHRDELNKLERWERRMLIITFCMDMASISIIGMLYNKARRNLELRRFAFDNCYYLSRAYYGIQSFVRHQYGHGKRTGDRLRQLDMSTWVVSDVVEELKQKCIMERSTEIEEIIAFYERKNFLMHRAQSLAEEQQQHRNRRPRLKRDEFY